MPEDSPSRYSVQRVLVLPLHTHTFDNCQEEKEAH